MKEQNTLPLVSVIMPVYNGEKTIEIAINSLLIQTYKNWICIIVNDGSTDGTKPFLDSLIDQRFKIIHLQKNVGRGAARQVALDNTVGDYLAYLDADDFFHRDKIMKQVEYLEAHKEVALVGTRTMTFNSVYIPTSVRGKILDAPLHYRLGDRLYISMPTSMVRLPEARNFKYNPKLNASEDRDFFSRYLNGKKYYNIPDILLFYSVTESTNYKKILQYTGFEIQRAVLLFGKNNAAALRILFNSSAKWIVYAITIPILGEMFFLKRRGVKPDSVLVKYFEKQKLLVKKLTT